MSSTNSLAESKPSNVEDKERRAYNVVRYWRWVHSAMTMATVITCGATFVCQSYVNAFFYPNCMLNADWTFVRNRDGKLTFQSSTAKWAFILGWFFLLFRPSESTFFQRKATTASRLVLPGILVCLVFFITCLVSAIMYQAGVQAWCNSVTRRSNGISSCSDVRNLPIQGKLSLHFYSFITTAQVMTWIGMFFWMFHLGLVVLRFFKHSDFPTYFYESESPEPTATLHSGVPKDTVTTLLGTAIVHSILDPGGDSHRPSLDSTQLGSGYSLLYSSEGSSPFDSGRPSRSFPSSAIGDRKVKETYEDLSSPEQPTSERTPVKVTLVDYGSTALIREGGQTTSEF